MNPLCNSSLRACLLALPLAAGPAWALDFVNAQALQNLDPANIRLDSDPPEAGARPATFRRSQKEAQLRRIAAPREGGVDVVARVTTLDDEDYQRVTCDFRHLASHAIAPRLNVGYTRTVVRRMEQATELDRQANGSFNEEAVPGRQAVSYGFGGTPPLSMRAVFTGNLAEFEKASACFTAYVDVLDKALAMLPLRSRRT